MPAALRLIVFLGALALAAPAAAHEPVQQERDSRWGPPGTFAEKVLGDDGRIRAAQASGAPSLAPVPRAECGPGDRPEAGIQGRVPPDADPAGYKCNLDLVGRHESGGGYKVQRFVDRSGRECAYYDSTLLFPTNAQDLSSRPTGAIVLDMSDPSNPKQTATLVTPAMQTPHESLVLNERRGLLAAVMGNPIFYPGHIDVYDVNEDCRNPVLQSSLPVGLLGHESGFAPDGNTFYATSISSGHVTAVDVSNPKLPVPIWEGNYESHGLTLSDDGNRAYLADSSGLIILDTTEVQQRKLNPQVREVSRLSWPNITIPQVAHPVTIGGRKFIVEIDEFSATDEGDLTGHGPRVGAGRIIDVENERAPKVVSNIRLAVNNRENRGAIGGDPGASSFVQGYAGHYCNIPQRKEPGIVACSFIASGLRVFDIRDPYKPKEIAYFTTPRAQSRTNSPPSNYAMSSPEFVPERREIWYSDGNSGFYALRAREGVWPFRSSGAPGGGGCRDRKPPFTRMKPLGVRASRTGIALRGTSRDRKGCASGVRKVEVSLARVKGRGDKDCRFLTSARRYRLTEPRNCRRPVLFTARGKRSWRFTFRVRLKPGKYRVQARGTDRATNKEKPFGRRNRVFFTVPERTSARPTR